MWITIAVFVGVVSYGIWRRASEQSAVRAYCEEHGHAWSKDPDGELVCLRCLEGVVFRPWRRYLGE